MIRTALERIARVGRGAKNISHLTDDQRQKLDHLKKHGYVAFKHLIGTSKLKNLQEDYILRLEQNTAFKTPCLAQSKICPDQNRELIENNFLATTAELSRLSLTFDRGDIESYEQVMRDYQPSTLTLALPDETDYLNVWLDKDLIEVAQGYMGFTPHLVEAYIRRNFPARFPVMNHHWHRDRNHQTHLLKGFIFFSDCTLKTGPHHYIAGSVNDQRLSGKNYYTDKEVHNIYPPDTDREIISEVPAGTIILEDTRGLHKAGIPQEGYRDLGFSVFLPPIALKRQRPLFNISYDTFCGLSDEQKRFIPSKNII